MTRTLRVSILLLAIAFALLLLTQPAVTIWGELPYLSGACDEELPVERSFTPTDFVFLPYVSKPRPPLGWVRIGPVEGDALLDIDVASEDSNRLYASTRTGLYRSTDRGVTWELALAGFFRQLVIDPQEPSILYTGPSDENWQYGVFKSNDGGDSWTRYSEGMTCDNLNGLSIAATEPNILFTGSF